jgi:hypothetical protein
MTAGNPDTPDNILMNNEAHFYLHSTIIKQNTCNWLAENLYEHHEHPLYNHEVTVCCEA